ncbi:hypothetical protein PSTG_02114 [Puccinia striiformis f. sp. tritici PST-78]|uniref:sterol 3beta-glucosyltransferase n=1 Tax=Puccinia striiformis f. sp. tritici PST-78 TaxID=1165861 RepID=A0A0L0VZC4_9BASI|nr:hypothetical protein PSTG_02114 [Puccinia striiformis f. sp. tritici PST-78]
MKRHAFPSMGLLVQLGFLAVGISLLTLPALVYSSKRVSSLARGASRPLKITCLTIGSRGDVQPFIALGLGLQKDGHAVTIATHLEFKDMIEESGIGFRNIGGNPQELIKHCVEHGFFSPEFYIEGYTKFRDWIDELLITVPVACQGADVLIESPTAMMGIHVAESMRIPYFRAFTMPWTPTSVYPHPFAVTSRELGKYYNRISYNIFNYLIWKGIESKVNKWREQKLKIKATSFAKLQSANIPFLYNFSEKIVPKPSDWGDRIHITGYWFRDQQEKVDQKQIEDKISPDLLSFIQKARDRGKKIIYIGFGSVIFPDVQEIQRKLEKAVRKAGVWAVVSGGWCDMKPHEKPLQSVLKSQYSPIHYVGSVPHEWLFSQVDATLTHGGAGTVAASLRAGIPTLIKPFFGKLVKKMGVGAHVKTFKVSELSRAFRKATTDLEQIYKAKKIGQAISKENGVRNAIQKMHQEMNNARKLMHGGLGRDDSGPMPKFPKEKVYFWLKDFLQREQSSIHYFILFILRSLQYSSIQQQNSGKNPQNLISPPIQAQSFIESNITLSNPNQTDIRPPTLNNKNQTVV